MPLEVWARKEAEKGHNVIEKTVLHVQVYAVDVGYGQLALELRQDPRVVVMERTNARHINQTTVSTQPNLVVCDASFIPLHKVRFSLRDSVRTSAHLITRRTCASAIDMFIFHGETESQVLPASLALCRPPALLLALIKPQFEAERHEIESGTGGAFLVLLSFSLLLATLTRMKHFLLPVEQWYETKRCTIGYVSRWILGLGNKAGR